MGTAVHGSWYDRGWIGGEGKGRERIRGNRLVALCDQRRFSPQYY